MDANQENIISRWVNWHFIGMPAFLFSIYKNYLAFNLEFFSVPLLLSTLFSPWRRELWAGTSRFDLGQFFEALIYNIFSRLMGAMLRLALIIVGIALELFILVIGLATIGLFVAIPFILVLLGVLFFYV